ncbi:MAG: hypothetical protein JNM27_04030 [Leptospirales bacterium]|nr:hypothetical protein [Leptospirales bacterium]
MSRPYPALGRLRHRKPVQRKAEQQPQKASGWWSGLLSDFLSRLRSEWSRRSGLFLSGLVFLAAGIVFCAASFIFMLSSLYVGLKLLTGSQLLALVLMFMVSATGAIFLIMRALSNFAESVEVERKDGELRIQD